MATLRTMEEKSAIVAHCVELEQEGGDILGYLWSQNYLTPRATWFNFQREWLKRKPYEFTSGRPNEKRKRRKSGMNPNQKQFTDEQRAECARIAIEGGDPKPYIKSLGFKNPSGAWHNLKEWYKKNRPEIAVIIPDRVGKVVVLPEVDLGMPKKIGPDGKEYEKLELEAGGNYQLSVKEEKDDIQYGGYVEVTEVDQAPPVEQIVRETEAETNKIRKPVNFGGYDVTAIRHPVFGEFHRDEKHDCIYWMSPDGEEVGMTPAEWIRFGLCLPDIMGILGVQV